MDLLKLIPQLFYDLIARIIPGAISAIIISFIFEVNAFNLLHELLQVGTLQKSVFFFISITFLLSYFAGHLLSHLSVFFEKLLKLISNSKSTPLAKRASSALVLWGKYKGIALFSVPCPT